jgi:Tfp pilus assembly protein PilZ
MSDEARRIPREFERELVQTETLVVEMRDEGGKALSGQSRNLSLNGIFVETREPVTVGAEVQLFIGSMSSSSALRVVATVVHVVPGEGFGAHFLDDTDEARDYVAAFIKRFRKHP